nr:phosphatase PAP2 family protein [uncultured Roseateles sp.]
MSALERPFKRDLIVCGLLLLALLAWDGLGWDLALTRHFGSAEGFAWREHGFTSGLLHQGGRLFGWAVFAALVFNVWKPLPGLGGAKAMPRRLRLWWLLSTIFCLILIPVLKRLSLSSCPWDLQEFGGIAQYVSHWRWGVADGGPGRCFPSGHASAAFAFIGGYFALREQHGRLARAFLIAACSLGAVFGLAQMARGAHYPSHTMWTAWICWTSTLLLFHTSRRWWAGRGI